MTEPEPLPADDALWQMENVIITPHIAGAAEEVLTNHTKMIVAEIGRFLKGQPLLYEYR